MPPPGVTALGRSDLQMDVSLPINPNPFMSIIISVCVCVCVGGGRGGGWLLFGQTDHLKIAPLLWDVTLTEQHCSTGAHCKSLAVCMQFVLQI